MQRRISHLATILSIATGAVLALSAIPQAQAADASGTWGWTGQARGGGEGPKITLKLKADGAKLTGTLTMPGRQGAAARDTEISDGKVTGDKISFNVVVERQGNKMTTKYSGTVSGDTIKGTTETERNGQTRSRDWEAKREK